MGLLVFANFKILFIKSETLSPFFSLRAGYTFNFLDYMKGLGFVFNPTLGINIKRKDKSFMDIGFGFESQLISPLYRRYYTNEPPVSLNGVVFYVAFLF